jgi:hypothetical protein
MSENADNKALTPSMQGWSLVAKSILCWNHGEGMEDGLIDQGGFFAVG